MMKLLKHNTLIKILRVLLLIPMSPLILIMFFIRTIEFIFEIILNFHLSDKAGGIIEAVYDWFPLIKYNDREK